MNLYIKIIINQVKNWVEILIKKIHYIKCRIAKVEDRGQELVFSQKIIDFFQKKPYEHKIQKLWKTISLNPWAQRENNSRLTMQNIFLTIKVLPLSGEFPMTASST